MLTDFLSAITTICPQWGSTQPGSKAARDTTIKDSLIKFIGPAHVTPTFDSTGELKTRLELA